ncbi:MAG: OsmC family protein [Bacteroidales bacterium]|nr:OsmC family protein [Bacteroidales bacterium]
MKDTVTVNWKENMVFEAEMDGHRFVMDAKEEHGGSDQGPRPKPLMMVSLAGCTGMDVISILKKMRVEVDEFSVKIDGDLTDEHPKHFTRMHIIYEFKGKNLPVDKLEKAIELSQDHYCGVSASYRKAMEITHEIKIH